MIPIQLECKIVLILEMKILQIHICYFFQNIYLIVMDGVHHQIYINLQILIEEFQKIKNVFMQFKILCKVKHHT